MTWKFSRSRNSRVAARDPPNLAVVSWPRPANWFALAATIERQSQIRKIGAVVDLYGELFAKPSSSSKAVGSSRRAATAPLLLAAAARTCSKAASSTCAPVIPLLGCEARMSAAPLARSYQVKTGTRRFDRHLLPSLSLASLKAAGTISRGG